jgi:hypothetical protein
MSAGAEMITRALGGHWHGRYGTAKCPAHDDRNPSLSLSDGSEGRLLARCHAGCSFAAILDALRGLGLVDGQSTFRPPSAEELARVRADERAHLAKQSMRAKSVWDDGATVSISGTVAETYLQSRGITCRLPPSLRYQPEGWHMSARRLPMMIGAVEGGERFAVHRTYLRPDGLGKADLEPAKAMLGPVAGGAVRLSEAEGPLVACEGIETGLSLMSGLLRAPATVWAALSTSGLHALSLPAIPGKLTIASDGDDPGRAAAHALATRATALGWRVSMLPAPEGRDWNDVLVKKGAAA